MSFSPEWLALREPVDHVSRSHRVADAVERHFAGRAKVRVLDLGCGTGSNLRASYALLPDEQDWLLVDHDPALLEAARTRLAAWGDGAREGDALLCRRDGKRIAVRFRQADLSAGIGGLPTAAADLVTASALFDLIGAEWIGRFAGEVAAANAAFYTVLTYDGRDAFTPAHPADADVIATFAAHQGGDKGFGPAAGPRAPRVLAEAFAAAGYRVVEDDSPWRLGADQAGLARELVGGIAQAVIEAGLPRAEAEGWRDFRLKHLEEGRIVTGHTDIFACPAPR